MSPGPPKKVSYQWEYVGSIDVWIPQSDGKLLVLLHGTAPKV